MPKQDKNFKHKIRGRMRQTGESYTTARRNIDVRSRESRQQISPGPGQFLYVKTLRASTGGRRLTPALQADAPGSGFHHYRVEVSWEVWIAQDGAGRVLRKPNRLTWLTPEGAAAWAADRAVEVPIGGTRGDRSMWPTQSDPDDQPYHDTGGLAYPHNVGLPEDPTELRRAIEADSANRNRSLEERSGDRFPLRHRTGWSPPSLAALVPVVSDLQAGAPIGLRRAAIEMLLTDRECEVLGPSRDSLDREGVAIAAPHDERSGLQSELLFDPATARVLETRSIVVGPPLRRRERRMERIRSLSRLRERWTATGIDPDEAERRELTGLASGENELPIGTTASYTTYVTEGIVASTTATPEGTIVPLLPRVYPVSRRSVPEDESRNGTHLVRHRDISTETWSGRFDSPDEARAASEAVWGDSQRYSEPAKSWIVQELTVDATGERWTKVGGGDWRIVEGF